MKYSKGRWALAGRIWLKGLDLHPCQLNRFIWIMQALRKGLRVGGERWAVLSSIFPGSEPQSLHVSCPQTKALQMNVISVPWSSNPCSMMSLSEGSGLFFILWSGESRATCLSHKRWLKKCRLQLVGENSFSETTSCFSVAEQRT